MTLQRFQNFQIGALDAARLNQMVDTIMRLERAVAQMQRPYEPTKDVILARITGSGTKTASEGCEGIVAVSYQFVEVGLAIAKEGAIDSSTCVRVQDIDGGLSTQNGAHLLMLEDEPSLEVGDVVKAHLASRASSGTAQDKGMVYIATPIVPTSGTVVTGIVIGGSPSGYTMEIDGTGESVDVLNLYEASAYYGAMEEQPECAVLSPLSIPDGSRIWAFQYRDEWFTCIPTPFSVACTCNDDTTGVGAARALASIESKATSAMLNIGRTVY